MEPNETTRQRKFAREMHRELSILFQQEVDGPMQALTTLTHVRVTPDLKLVRVYFSCLPDEKAEPIRQLLTTDKGQMRKLLGDRIRHQVRSVPELEFYVDDTPRTAARIEELFDRIRAEGPPSQQD